MNKRYIPLLIAMLFLVSISGNTYGQRRQQQKTVLIESVVVDDSGTPVPNAVISGKEGAIEVMTDSEGRFSIEVPENSDLLIEAKGFNKLAIPVSLASRQLTLNRTIFLMDDASLVNVAFGKMYKREIVGAVSTVDTKDVLKYDNSQFIYDLIRGRVPGMLGNSNIRGIGTPIFVVDGVPRDALNINAEEVEQITVLKDVNSAILWGSQAKNGVILITTKRGQPLKRKINISAEQGMSAPVVLPKFLNSAEYMGLYNEALANDGLSPAFDDTLIAKYADGQNPYRYPSVDYYSSEYLRSSKPFTKILTEFSGGNEITQYYANVGWIHSGSIYNLGEGRNANTNRFNVRGNVDFKVTDAIKSFVDALVVIDNDKNPRNDYWSYASSLRPYYFSPITPGFVCQEGRCRCIQPPDS
jgi:TonB-dependent SusC/RagA subfamily outer membrane receptor